MIGQLFNILIFPGFLFLAIFGFAAEYFDRKLYARLQNRIGPPWFQPLADFLKLMGKEEVIPEEANPRIFKLMPIFAVASGDIIVVLYLLTIPTLTLFLGGWYSTSLYSKLGAVRSITQLFAYEVPLFISILAPALLANTWSIAGMAAFYSTHPWYWTFNLLGFAISLIAMLGKLEKVPFDIAEAETEIVAGTLTEYSGRLLGIVGASLLAAVFLPFGFNLGPAAGFILYILKVLFIIGLMSLSRTVFARLRIDQMMILCWKYIAPLAFLQLLLNLFLKGVLTR
jgi:NADH-quinone oxidoreductase subunit H